MSEVRCWRSREWLTGALLFLASAAFTLWQNSRVAVLWDLSYLLDSAWRFSLGQIPYREIPFAHAPLTFLLHAEIIRIFSRVYYPHIVCAALECGIATILTWRITIRVLASMQCAPQVPAIMLTIPLICLGIYGIYPHPIYDSDCVLAVLVALYLGIRGHDTEGLATSAAAGSLCVVPVLFKQNIGLPFLVVMILAMALVAVLRRAKRASIAPPISFFAGAILGGLTALVVLHLTIGLGNYWYWTITFASQRRLPGLALMLSSYDQTSLLWTIPATIIGLLLVRLWTHRPHRWVKAVAVLLLAAPFLWTMVGLFLTPDPDDRADQLLSLWPHLLLLAVAFAIWSVRPEALKQGSKLVAMLPVILLATIHGAFLSQQLWGSTYAMWPLLVILTAMMLTQVGLIARPLALAISATFLISGGLYAVSLERLSYIHLDGPRHAATLPQLRHLTTPGPWIPNFEELVHYANANIPAQDGVLLIPGEDPFFFATGRTPQFPILLFDPATDPYSPEQTVQQVRAQDIRWLIIKRDLQLTGPPHPQLAHIEAVVQQDFAPYAKLTAYDIYRRP